MDRLTKRFEDGEYYSDEFGAAHKIKITYENGKAESVYEGKLVDKLAEYEDLEESGRLVKLPCVLGTTVYVIYTGMSGKHPTIFSESFSYKHIDKVGTAVFLTRKAAEAKLKEMEE